MPLESLDFLRASARETCFFLLYAYQHVANKILFLTDQDLDSYAYDWSSCARHPRGSELVKFGYMVCSWGGMPALLERRVGSKLVYRRLPIKRRRREGRPHVIPRLYSRCISPYFPAYTVFLLRLFIPRVMTLR
ncbi:unnamed protein product, partial [Ectocarpus sp. 12 AP-2014]